MYQHHIVYFLLMNITTCKDYYEWVMEDSFFLKDKISIPFWTLKKKEETAPGSEGTCHEWTINFVTTHHKIRITLTVKNKNINCF